MAFVVEDGTGLETATSYVTVEFADSYLEDNQDWIQPKLPEDEGYDADFEAQLLAAKKVALNQSTQGIDLMYSKSFKGYQTKNLQALEWPRSFVTYGSIPIKLKQAVCELAVEIYNQTGDAVRDLNPLVNVTERTISGAGFTKSEKYQEPASGVYREGLLKVELLLQKLVEELDNSFAPAYFNR